VDSIAILDFGSQYAQLIARRVREANVYCELFPWNSPPEQVLALQPKGFILSGGPASVYQAGAPQLPPYVLQSGLPILGICYGMQALAHALGGWVAAAAEREYGAAEVEVTEQNPLMPPGHYAVWMSHGDRVDTLPPGFRVLASSPNAPCAAMTDERGRRFGLQFHPEVHHTPQGSALLRAFIHQICGASPEWTPQSIIERSISEVRRQVGHQPVLAAVSGGVDSSVAAALVLRAIDGQLTCVFVDTGLLRLGEAQQVVEAFESHLGARLIAIDARQSFLDALRGITDPEAKRQIIGEKFIRTFEAAAERAGRAPFLVQGTIYPDVVESSAPDRRMGDRIKTHHNVGGLPADLGFKLVEPLRYLFKDEVRTIGVALGLPERLVWRQPFPGPGLAVRCLGDVSPERLERLRLADKIYLDELEAGGLNVRLISQAFAALLPVRSVGVMGDQRTYGETVVLRAVVTEDYMTADWARLPYDLLAKVSRRIVNEVAGVNRVVYDLTSKPPATIEWE
jgi:GMP synthase (glutamine-hydrolysing)